MGQRVIRGIEFPDDATDQEVAALLASVEPDRAPTPQPEEGSPDWSVAPLLGGMAGGIGGLLLGGPPGALIGATLGGGMGQGARMAAVPEDRPINAGDALLRLLVESAKQGAGELMGQGPAMLAGPSAVRLMQSALKPTTATVQAGKHLGVRSKADVAKAVLREPRKLGRVTRGTAERLSEQIDTINQDIAAILEQGTSRGAVVGVEEALRPFNELAQRALTQVDPSADLATVTRLAEGLRTHPLVKSRFMAPESGPAERSGFLPIQAAQRVKTGTYQQLKDRYGELGSFEIEAQKGGARGLKEGIAAGAPEIAAKNLRESQLLFVERAVTDALNRAGNRDPLGFANAAPTTKRFWLAMADRSPAVKSALARAIRGPVRWGAMAAPTLGRGTLLGLEALDEER